MLVLGLSIYSLRDKSSCLFLHVQSAYALSISFSYKSWADTIKNMVHSHHAFLILHAPCFPFLLIHTFLRDDSAKNYSGSCILPLLAKILSQCTLVLCSTRIYYWLNIHCIKCSIYFETPLDLQYFGVPFLF